MAVMRTLELLLVFGLLVLVSPQKKRFCPVMTWTIEFSDVKTLHPGRSACYPFCEEREGNCVFTTNTREGDVTFCRAFINRTDTGKPPETLYLAMKFCVDHMRPCGSKNCKDCFPCYHHLHRRARSACGMKLIHLRYNHVETMKESDPDVCLHDCVEDADCVWAESFRGNCDKFRIVGDELEAPVANLTLQDLECSPH